MAVGPGDHFSAGCLERRNREIVLGGSGGREADHRRVRFARDRRVMDKTPPANMTLDQSFGFQKFIGGRNCRPVQSKLTSQFAGGR